MRNRERVIILVLALLLTISVGYATLMTTITINGTTTIKANNWNVYIESVSNISSTSTATITTNPSVVSGSTTTTSLNYEVILNQPGDYYEFQFTVKNAGSLDIKLSKNPVLEGVTTDQDVYFNHTLKNLDGTDVAVTDAVIPAGDSRTYKVRVEYDSNINNNQLPTTNQTLNLTATLEFVQA